MTSPGFRLRHLIFLGPQRAPATMTFGPGLNLVYGASDSGKSFMVEAIDFMLGGGAQLRDIPERAGYDRVLLGIEKLDGSVYTIFRSIDGGRFRLFDGLHTKMPDDSVPARVLADSHTDKNADNLSAFLLELTGLSGQRVRKNKSGDTNSLSFRNIARLVIVTETEITDQRSPLKDGNPTADTPNFATFKLLLTGVDDFALVAAAPSTPEDASREAQIELLDQLITDYRDRLKALTRSPKELEEQLGKLESALQHRMQQLGNTEANFKALSSKRRELRSKLEEAKDRQAEIMALLERFSLLDQHYQSDEARLAGIEETGVLFVTLGQQACPLCGAKPAHHQPDRDCDGNIDAVVAAARIELSKIALLRRELADTKEALMREAAAFDRSVPRSEAQLRELSMQIDLQIGPQLNAMRGDYAQLADKRGEVREALGMLRTLQDVEKRRIDLDKDVETQKSENGVDGDLSVSTAQKFAEQVEAILKAWHFPGADRVFFDSKTRDLVIAGKARISRGKGLRAITHAAFTIGLLDYCRTHQTPHPGFVILDLPLLAYRGPEPGEEDLRSTDLNEQFFSYLAQQPEDRQIIIVENDDPPEAFKTGPQVTFFSGNESAGRAGLFPAAPLVPGLAPPASSSNSGS